MKKKHVIVFIENLDSLVVIITPYVDGDFALFYTLNRDLALYVRS